MNMTSEHITAESLNQEEVQRLAPLVLYLVIIFLAGIPGNGLVCYAFRTSYKTSNPHLFFLWLGILDLTTCCVILPAETVNVFAQYTYSNAVLCKLTIFFSVWFTISSGITLCVISIDRYRKVCCPLDWQISNKNAKIACLMTVVVALVFAWPSLILFGIHSFPIHPYNVTGIECSILYEYEITSYPMVYNATLWISFVSGIAIIGIAYGLIGNRIFHQNKKALHRSQSELIAAKNSTRIVNDDTSTSTASPSPLERGGSYPAGSKTSVSSNGGQLLAMAHRQARARKSAFIMFLISLVFVLTFLPYLILRLCQAIDIHFVDNMSNTGRAVYKFVLRWYFLNSAANPFIYCACAPQFVNESKKLFRRLCRR